MPPLWNYNSIACSVCGAAKIFRQTLLCFSVSLFLAQIPVANAQWDEFASDYNELARVLENLNASRILLYDALQEMSTDPATQQARNSLQRQLDMQANMSMQDMMAQGHNMSNMTTTTGLFDELEAPVRATLLEFLNSKDKPSNIQLIEEAVTDASFISNRLRSMLDHGAHFRAKIYEIYTDEGITNKRQAVTELVAWYSDQSEISVATVPKLASLALDHRHASAFARAYPTLNALHWSSRWIELATIETLMLEYLNNELENAVEIGLDRFWQKVNAIDLEAKSSSSPIPVERPTAPAIAPQLYNAHPEAAIIFDNLSMFETVVLDILAYPNLDNRQDLIEATVDEFIDAEINLSENMDYIVSALRGGIFDQGGPASGELSQSERNRSRGNMEMEHDTPKPGSAMRID